MNSIYETAKNIALGCGEIVIEGFHHIQSVKEKSMAGDIVTDVDLRSEAYALNRLKNLRPEDSILSEECGIIKGSSEYTWIIDPLDGTYNFALGIPFFCVSIGVLKNNKPYIGVIYDPVHKEMFSAKRGEGAFLNDSKIEMGGTPSFDACVLYISWVRGVREKSDFTRITQKISHDTGYIRRLGSAALAFAYVASNRIHGVIESGLSSWDVAAGVLIVEEAGGMAKDFFGQDIDIKEPKNEIIASSKDLYSHIKSTFPEIN